MKENAPQMQNTHLNGNLSIADYPKVTSTKVIVQRQYILSVIKQFGSANTIELQNLGIKHPAARIMELKMAGVPIASTRETYTCHAGLEHKRVKRYFISSSNDDSQLSLFDDDLACA
ncbi:MAG: helix-turn-helix domain-containing protein [Thiomicrorhabdus chilensis]|uniref:helix-turn-helix domain-containing protein n=1 Tax=Thiomicrorhabdus chilensis TaxID=63656 RepID=UPI00299D8033|nr:helix-turn-helix domain-containing protein [Thiomicrorhabdus chilensis]MDX1346968.1 helix-turn-helix domain-containing protein [Thiomicrorhabdus chilensis]